MQHVTLEQARAARPAALRTFEHLSTVNGVGISRVGEDYVLKVNLREPIPRGVDVPAQVDGVPVRVEVTGAIRRLS
jgi:hypothetical protein